MYECCKITVKCIVSNNLREIGSHLHSVVDTATVVFHKSEFMNLESKKCKWENTCAELWFRKYKMFWHKWSAHGQQSETLDIMWKIQRVCSRWFCDILIHSIRVSKERIKKIFFKSCFKEYLCKCHQSVMSFIKLE